MTPSRRDALIHRPRIAITMGDPHGIGPELALSALGNERIRAICRPLVIGDTAVLRRAAQALDLPATAVEEDAIVQVGGYDATQHAWGSISAAAGRLAADAIERAVALALTRDVDAIVTGPLHKEALHRAGVPHPGHTEMLAALTGCAAYAMMLVGPTLRVIHVSTHVSLREALARIEPQRIGWIIDLAHAALVQVGIATPRIAVAGVNPHAGEGGLFGSEEITAIAPAIAAARDRGIDATGPHAPDTIFLQASRGRYDIVVAMYHDQGHIAAKITDFAHSINVTVGLPIIRTSVDHGTAFDIAGRGSADPSSLLAAIEYAVKAAGG
jgi:4-phospho-D-threonate 3-dehydrogenase / 4-phospho-D-erythronate 3-dehydrogenase